MTTNSRDIALVLLLTQAPLAVLWLIALLRGYDIELRITRRRKDRPED